MTSRRESVLEAIVREYIETAEPVGSLMIVHKYRFPFSPATIRAEMAILEEEGYIIQPHTSAGRVPTQKGYRYYVNMIEKEQNELTSREDASLRRRIEAMHLRYEKMFDVATQALSEITRNVSLGAFGGEIYSHGLARLFRQPEFLDVERVLSVADLIDNLPLLVREIPQNKEFMVFIGSESPVGKSANCSLVMARVNLPGEFGYLGVLGPTRMSYERIIPLVSRTKRMIEETV